MKKYPDTIKHPQAFERGRPAGFDGVFDWSWTNGCFGRTKIEPMDFDGVVERKGQFLVFETKDINVPVKQGQMITLKTLHRKGDVTIMFIWGKSEIDNFEVWLPIKFIAKPLHGEGVAAARAFVKKWYEWADSGGF